MPVRERVGDTPDAPVVVRTPDDELASVMIDHGIGGPVRSDRILPRTSGDAMRRIRTLVEGENLAAARQTLAVGLRSPGFEAAFERGDVRGWPVGIVPELTQDEVRRVPRALRAALTPRAITDRMRRGKLRVRHPEVGAAQYRLLQRALDRGELLLRSPQRREKLTSLIVHAPRAEGGWWRYAIKIDSRGERLWLSTVHATSDRKREDRIAAGTDRALRGWSRERWSDE